MMGILGLHPWLAVLTAAVVVGVGLLVRGLFLGYPAADPASVLLNAKEQAIVLACADTLLPQGEELPAFAGDGGIVTYFDRLMQGVPPRSRPLLRVLLRFLEHGPWIFGLRPRLTRQSRAARIRTLDAWNRSSIYLLRLSFTSIRTLLALALLSDERVLARIGATPNARPFESKGAAA
jgi:hypothetical protein